MHNIGLLQIENTMVDTVNTRFKKKWVKAYIDLRTIETIVL